MFEAFKIKPPPKKLETLEVVRAFAALGVVVFHAREQTLTNGFGDSLLPVFDYGRYGVHVFFVLSGFIILFIHGKDLGCPGQASSYFYRRWLRIWPIYALLTLFQVVVKWVGFGQAVESPSQILTSLFFLDLEDTPIITVGWTLVHEAFFYVIFGVLIVLGPRFSGWFGIGFLLCMAILHFDVAGANPLVDFSFSHVKWFFLAGIAAACLTPIQWTELPGRSKQVGVLLLLGMTLVGIITLCGQGVGRVAGHTVILAVILGLGMLTLVRFDLRCRPRMPRLLVYLGAASYSIYLVHATVLSRGFDVLSRWKPTFLLDHRDLAMTGLALGSVLCGIVCHEILEKPLIHWIKGFSKNNKS